MGVVALLITANERAWSNENSTALEFFLQPKLCVLPQEQERCEDELEIRWQARKQRHLCLYRRESGTALTCWENQIAGNYRMRISASRDIVFQLRDMPDDKIIVSEIFEVVHDQSKFRRKRRNAWSFF